MTEATMSLIIAGSILVVIQYLLLLIIAMDDEIQESFSSPRKWYISWIPLMIYLVWFVFLIKRLFKTDFRY
jgi:hypothetical protein